MNNLNFYLNVVCLTTDVHLRMEEQRNIKYLHIYNYTRSISLTSFVWSCFYW